MCVCARVLVCLCVCVSVCVCGACMQACVHACVHVGVYVCICTYVHLSAFTLHSHQSTVILVSWNS